jgi:hypothetical protein
LSQTAVWKLNNSPLNAQCNKWLIVNKKPVVRRAFFDAQVALCQ